ncbi:FtsK/SpoIIIE domain-containing protein [Amycolatopsis magusensis]|uniref:FtsK/SpoIIIE domain-containing protein n=1 Tax=Amycolatopsis magusensis TaxID=882444 RepID=UPI0037AC0DEC
MLLELLGVEGPDDSSTLRTAWSTGVDLRTPLGHGESGEPVELDLAAHCVCVGMPGSGKSELVRTVVTGLAVRNSPESVNFLLAGTADGLTALPHVATVARDADQLTDLLDDEIRHRIRLRGSGDIGKAPVLVVVVDEIGEASTRKPLLADSLLRAARLGDDLRLHLLLTGRTTPSGAMRGLYAFAPCRIALPSATPATDGQILGVPDVAPLPALPGNGYLKSDFTQPPRRFELARVPEGRLARLGELMSVHGNRARPLWPPLGTVTYDVVRERNEGGEIPFALPEEFYSPLELDFADEPHLLVFGERRTGRTSVLRTVVCGLRERYTVAEAVVIVADPRRQLLGLVEPERLLAYATNPAELRTIVSDAVTSIRKRLGQDWHGPDLFFVVDDYDAIPAEADELQPLLELLPYGKQIGLRFIAAGTEAMTTKPIVAALEDAPTLRLTGKELPGTAPGGRPGLPAVGFAEYGGKPVLVPWHQDLGESP